MISVSVTTLDADVSAQIADLIRKRLQIYITQYRTNKSRKDVEYTRKIVAESRVQYIKAQQKYSAYCDANEDIGLMSLHRLETDWRTRCRWHTTCINNQCNRCNLLRQNFKNELQYSLQYNLQQYHLSHLDRNE